MSKTSLHLQPKGNDEVHQNDGTGEVPRQAAPSVPYGHPIYYSSSPRLNIVHTAPGCKRIIVDPGYLESLHRPNVTLNFDTIERIVPRGVQLKNWPSDPARRANFRDGILTRAFLVLNCTSADSFCWYLTAASSVRDLWRRGPRTC